MTENQGIIINTSSDVLDISSGDINGDLISDLLISSNSSAFIILGSPTPKITYSLPITIFDTNPGVITIQNNGTHTSYAGDINNDGFGDIFLSKDNQVFLFWGSNSYPAEQLNFEELNDGLGIRITPKWQHRNHKAKKIGDINNDGVNDFIISSSILRLNDGQHIDVFHYVIFGNSNLTHNGINLNNLTANQGFEIYQKTAVHADLEYGLNTNASGNIDFNGDEIGDFIIGAGYELNDNNIHSGRVYVIYGSEELTTDTLELNELDGSNGLIINGISHEDLAGGSVSAIKDFNNDGYGDIIISARKAKTGFDESTGVTNRYGQSYIIFGANYSSPNINN